MNNELLNEFQGLVEARQEIINGLEKAINMAVAETGKATLHAGTVLAYKLNYGKIDTVDIMKDLESIAPVDYPGVNNLLEDFNTIDTEARAITPDVETVLAQALQDSWLASDLVKSWFHGKTDLDTILNSYNF